tara:strand:+ start:1109 stop:1867 length:759 start_codon:yes stop_codon:yes gene_type:complete
MNETNIISFKGMDKNKIKVYALLAAHSYPKRRKEGSTHRRVKYLFTNTRKVDLNSPLLKKYIKLDSFCSSRLCAYLNKIENEIVVSIRGTDLSFPEDGDALYDYHIFKGTEKKTKIYEQTYDTVKKIIKEYPKKDIVLVAHSLGARISIDLLDSNLGGEIKSVHAFNPGTSLAHLYNSNKCFMSNKSSKTKVMCDKRDRKLYIHLINKDPLSVLSIGEKAKTHKIHNRKYVSTIATGKKRKIKKSHSILNFI